MLLCVLSDCQKNKPPYPHSYGLNSTTIVLVQGWI